MHAPRGEAQRSISHVIAPQRADPWLSLFILLGIFLALLFVVFIVLTVFLFRHLLLLFLALLLGLLLLLFLRLARLLDFILCGVMNHAQEGDEKSEEHHVSQIEFIVSLRESPC